MLCSSKYCLSLFMLPFIWVSHYLCSPFCKILTIYAPFFHYLHTSPFFHYLHSSPFSEFLSTLIFHYLHSSPLDGSSSSKSVMHSQSFIMSLISHKLSTKYAPCSCNCNTNFYTNIHLYTNKHFNHFQNHPDISLQL